MSNITVTQTIGDYRAFINRIYKPPNDFYSFGLIALGFEFLGQLLQTNYKPGVHFDGRKCMSDSLNMLTHGKYNCISDLIYSKLRNGFLHSLRPKGEFWLRNNENKGKCKHLEVCDIDGRKLICLVIEDFLADFNEACDRILMMIENKEIDVSSINYPYIKID